MPRRRAEQIELSTFPFLSVLCAVIGIMMLLLLGTVSVRAVQGGTSVATPQEYTELEQEIRRLGLELEERQQKRRELAALHARLEDLIAAKEDEAELATAGADGRRLGTQLGVPDRVRFVPDPNRKITKKPVLVEVRTRSFLVHATRQEFPVGDLEREDSELTKFLRHMDEVRDREYLMLIVHPSGVDSYDKLREHLVEHYGRVVRVGGIARPTSRIDVGVEPFGLDWLLIDQPSQSQP